jgi:hypothetical protein
VPGRWVLYTRTILILVLVETTFEVVAMLEPFLP